MKLVTVAATQMACDWNLPGNLDRAETLVRQAAADGAQVILLQELFETPYFCIEQSAKHFELASSVESSPLIQRFAELARELAVVLPISWFERAGQAFFNSLAMIDADGKVLGVYRKSHIPNAIGYQEKTYFSPGDTGFRVWDTAYARIGVGICWDQWFPEAARAMTLMGAELLLYPTAIGSEPNDPSIDSMPHWQRTMQGHAAANVIPVVASNRIGREVATENDMAMTFYGSSFIADHTGAKVQEANRTESQLLTHTFDLDTVAAYRAEWGLFRDRRPDLYQTLATLDGQTPYHGQGEQ
ncbi:N-carbamoylputrescine amidase [Marinobacter hydrocarbonoclasticus]|nr:N-carbamoylputrescine amidase [Marinobacter nauticus]